MSNWIACEKCRYEPFPLLLIAKPEGLAAFETVEIPANCQSPIVRQPITKSPSCGITKPRDRGITNRETAKRRITSSSNRQTANGHIASCQSSDRQSPIGNSQSPNYFSPSTNCQTTNGRFTKMQMTNRSTANDQIAELRIVRPLIRE